MSQLLCTGLRVHKKCEFHAWVNNSSTRTLAMRKRENCTINELQRFNQYKYCSSDSGMPFFTQTRSAIQSWVFSAAYLYYFAIWLCAYEMVDIKHVAAFVHVTNYSIVHERVCTWVLSAVSATHSSSVFCLLGQQAAHINSTDQWIDVAVTSK